MQNILILAVSTLLILRLKELEDYFAISFSNAFEFRPKVE